MNYYISGSTGFIGSAIAKYLWKKGESVYAIPRGKTIEELEILFDNANPDYIIHAGAYGNHKNQTDFLEMVNANIINTFHILEAAQKYEYKKIYNITTSSTQLKHQTEYAITKRCGESLASMYDEVVNVRPYSVYGEGEGKHRFIPTVIRHLINGDEMELDEEAEHSWIYIDDFVQAMFKGVTELGGITVSNFVIVALLEEITGKRLRYKKAKLREYDCGDVKPPKAICYTPLIEGLTRTYEYYARQGN